MRSFAAVFIGLIACISSSVTHAQPSPRMTSAQSGTHHYKALLYGPFAAVKPGISGAAYSAEQIMEFVDNLTDGRRNNRTWREWVYRDSQGRTRTERMMSPPRADLPSRLVQIVDPIAGFQYVIDTPNKVAHRIRVPPAGSTATGEAAGSMAGELPLDTPSIAALSRSSFHQDTLIARLPAKESSRISTEALGLRWIDGILAQGTKTTITDGSITISTEAWVSEHLKVLVLSKRDDPRLGEASRVTRIVNYSSTVPDPALFQPPPDYTIVEEPGKFSIDIVVPAIDTELRLGQRPIG
jgi:hypothetical protein